MAKLFKPNVCYISQDGKRVYYVIQTYVEVKKRMNAFMNASLDDCVRVSRSRRGEWGEWFEHWEKRGNKNVIVKQGWL